MYVCLIQLLMQCSVKVLVQISLLLRKINSSDLFFHTDLCPIYYNLHLNNLPTLVRSSVIAPAPELL